MRSEALFICLVLFPSEPFIVSQVIKYLYMNEYKEKNRRENLP